MRLTTIRSDQKLLSLDGLTGLAPMVKAAKGGSSLRLILSLERSQTNPLQDHRGTTMNHYVGIDVSLEALSVRCAADDAMSPFADAGCIWRVH